MKIDSTIIAEAVSVQNNNVCVLALFNAAETICSTEDFGRNDSDGFEGLFGGQAVVDD
jgi:hypothetical protein